MQDIFDKPVGTFKIRYANLVHVSPSDDAIVSFPLITREFSMSEPLLSDVVLLGFFLSDSRLFFCSFEEELNR